MSDDRKISSRHSTFAPLPDVPADVDGLRGLLGDAIMLGIGLMKESIPDCRTVLLGGGRPFRIENDPQLKRGVDDLVVHVIDQLRHVFPRHMADGSRALPHLQFLAEWAVMTGVHAYRNHATRKKKSRAQLGTFRGLPVDPRWLADAADLLLDTVLPILHLQGVPIPGSYEFLEGDQPR